MKDKSAVMDVEEEVAFEGQEELIKPAAHVSSASAKVTPEEEPKKPEPKKAAAAAAPAAPKLSDAEVKANNIKDVAAILGLPEDFLKDFELWPFCDQCHVLYDLFKAEDGELGIEGLDRFLRVLGQESPIQELRSIMAEWGDKKSGKMSFEQFVDMVERQAESWKTVDELVEEHQLLLFRSFKFYDENRDGNITADELQTALEKAGEKCTLEEVQLLFRHGDRNDDGLITVDEWMMFMADVEIKK